MIIAVICLIFCSRTNNLLLNIDILNPAIYLINTSSIHAHFFRELLNTNKICILSTFLLLQTVRYGPIHLQALFFFFF